MALMAVVPGVSSQVVTGGVAIVAVPALSAGAVIGNPPTAEDQGIDAAEPLFVSFGGSAGLSIDGGTFTLEPGESYQVPSGLPSAVSVNAATSGHRFSVLVLQLQALNPRPTPVPAPPLPGFQISQALSAPFAVKLDWLFSAVPGDPQDHRLANAVIIALGTDRRALPDDTLPDPRSTDRRGWWGDTSAAAIWGGWPVGTRLWLLRRAKLTDSNAREGATIERARRYIREALDPFVTARIATKYTVDLAQVGTERISGTVTIYRGPKSAVALQFQDLWRDFGG